MEQQPGTLMAELREAAEFVRTKLGVAEGRCAQVGVVLGSGLGAWADTLEDKVVLPYGEIPHMPRSAVVGHAGNLVFGRLGSVKVACLSGRVHTYEGHAMDKIVFGARLLGLIGCGAVLLTNAAGGIRQGFVPGDLMLLSDHLNLLGKNPLIGPNVSELGTRFPDMTEAYTPKVREHAREAAKAVGVTLHEGVYAALLGPSYETPAEIRMLRTLGADAVGMSTVPEVIALGHMGIPTGAISCITNVAAGLGESKLDHSEVEATAKAARAAFISVLSGWVSRVGAGVS